MLTRLQVTNIALIDKSDIAFDAGFSVLTGETGAGKSILIESVSFVLGERASRESIRTGAEKASVEATFLLSPDSPVQSYLRQQQLDNGDELVLYRELSLSGRNVCRVNGTLVGTAELKTVGDLLVDLHGQHAHQSLLNPETHLALIDADAKSDSDGLKSRTEEARQAALKAKRDLDLLKNGLLERERRIDALMDIRELAHHDGAVFLAHAMRLENLHRREIGGIAAREEQTAGRVAVQPMHGLKIRLAQLLAQNRLNRTRPSVRQETRRLVGHDKIFQLDQHANMGLCTRSALTVLRALNALKAAKTLRDFHQIAGLERMVRNPDAPTIHPDAPPVDDRLRGAARQAQTSRQVVQQRLAGIGPPDRKRIEKRGGTRRGERRPRHGHTLNTDPTTPRTFLP